jgi:Xaa-Pro aminopeptidase
LAPNLVAGVVEALRALGLGSARVGFDDLRLATHVSRELTGLHWSDAHDAWLDIRKVKTPEEIALLRTGAAINEDGLREILPLITPGTVWRDVAGRFREYAQSRGANLLAARKALQFGAEYNGVYFPDLMFADSSWTVREGQTIIFESWGEYGNYAFDMSRTAHVGEPSAEYARICRTVSETHIEAEKCLRAGITTHQAWQEISRIAYAMDIPTPKKTLVFIHSIGLDIIEMPSGYPAFGRVKDWELEENTVINFEYLYFGHSVSPYHLESTYLIGKDGAVQLQVSQSVEDILGSVRLDGNDQPIIGRRTTDSFVSAMSGEIVVLGGLQRTITTKSTSRLGPIPFLGDLFGSSTDLEEKQELIIFLRPYVLNGSAVDNLDALSRATSSAIGPEAKKALDNVPGKIPAAPEKK